MDKYRTLKAWQHCHALALAVCEAAERLPVGPRFWLADQMQRAAVSACANIAEGYARRGPREFKRFLGISISSLAELDALLLIARDRAYVSGDVYAGLRAKYVEASKTTYGLLRSIGG